MFRAQTCLDSGGAVLWAIALLIATAVLRRRSRRMSIPQSYTAHMKHFVVLRLQKTYTFHKKA